MSGNKMARSTIVRTWVGGPRKVKDNVKARTKINVKPYVVIMCEGKILCDGDEEIPVVFDNKVLAEAFVVARGYSDCELKTVEIEEIIKMCRSSKISFNSFYLIDHISQVV